MVQFLLVSFSLDMTAEPIKKKERERETSGWTEIES